jgi:hypothetical protein
LPAAGSWITLNILGFWLAARILLAVGKLTLKFFSFFCPSLDFRLMLVAGFRRLLSVGLCKLLIFVFFCFSYFPRDPGGGAGGCGQGAGGPPDG